MSAFATESQSLRSCNLPDTPHWRNWLRSTLPSQEISTGRIYDRALVETLAAKIRPVNGDIVLPPEQKPARAVPSGIQFSGPTATGREAERPLSNRNGPKLETR